MYLSTLTDADVGARIDDAPYGLEVRTGAYFKLTVNEINVPLAVLFTNTRTSCLQTEF